MKIIAFDIYCLTPVGDSYWVLRIKTSSGLMGWGEFTDSRNDTLACTIVQRELSLLLGENVEDIKQFSARYQRACNSETASLRVLSTALSGIMQALWDISAQSANLPLYLLLAGSKKVCSVIPLYANLNRGLLHDRSPAAFATSAKAALEAGFAFVKVTPFDEVNVLEQSVAALAPGLQRLTAVLAVVAANKVAVDFHHRFNALLAIEFLQNSGDFSALYWIEDLLDESVSAEQTWELRQLCPQTLWASGEDVLCKNSLDALLAKRVRPDVFMPDVKQVCTLDRLCRYYAQARNKGCLLSAHNPYGPISTAFSVHVGAAMQAELPIEFAFGAVVERAALCNRAEPIEHGSYQLSEQTGIGIGHSESALRDYGKLIAKGEL